MLERFKGRKIIRRWIFYLAGFLILTMGIAFSVKSNLGVSPVSAIPHAMSLVLGIDMGYTTMMFHAFLVLIQLPILRKKFKPINILQVGVGILFGYFTSFSNWCVTTYIPDVDNLFIRFVFTAISIVLIATGVFCYFAANIMPLPSEGCMAAIAQVTKWPFTRVKTLFDCAMALSALVICLIAFHNLGSIGIGTVAAAVLVGFVMKFWTFLFGKKVKKFLAPVEK